MKITKVSYTMVRQISQFHPATYSIEAEVSENETVEQVAEALQRLTIMVLYKDQPKMRDELIKGLITDTKQGSESKPVSNIPSF